MMKISIRFLALTFAMAMFALSAFSQGQTIYNSIPTTLDGNYPSQPFQAQQASEFGDRIQFAIGGRKVIRVTQTMSSWGCQSGAWYSADCVTTPGATFSHPITLNIYNVGPGNSVGSLVGSVTQTFNIPYRPSADMVNCIGTNLGKWYDAASGTCFNGYATNITFNVSALTVPNQVIYGIAFNTSNYGYSPIGPSACSASAAGCGYDSLNVALGSGAPSVGTDTAPDDAYFNTITAAWYCDGGSGGTGTFRLDAGCWTGFDPLVKFVVAFPATTAGQCKDGGWQARTRENGSSFKNQGDCVSYTNNGR
jgi:hypothetical protein